MVKNNPSITVLMPVYNGEYYLDDAIQSVLNQTCSDFEFLIINDGSTDTTRDILDRYGAKDDRIRLVHQENIGLIKTLNKGVGLASAPLIARMDADDICLPERLQKQKRYMAENPNIIVLGGSIERMTKDGQKIRILHYPQNEQDVKNVLTIGSPVAHPAVMMRKSYIENIGGYRAAYLHAEDYDLWLRVYESGGEITNLPDVLLRYRFHESSVSGQNFEQQALSTLYAYYSSSFRSRGKKDLSKNIERPLQWSDFDQLNLTPKERSELSVKKFNIFYGRGRASVTLEDALCAYADINLNDVDAQLRGQTYIIMAKFSWRHKAWVKGGCYAFKAFACDPKNILCRVKKLIKI